MVREQRQEVTGREFTLHESGRLAERVGFEPTVAKGYTRSPGAPDSPLQHLSAFSERGLISSRSMVTAERVGFEPTLRLRGDRFSRAAP